MSSDVATEEMSSDVVTEEVEQILVDPSNPDPCQLLHTADIVTESDIIHYKEMLSKQEPLDDASISKWLGSIINTHSGLREAHNVDALVKTVHELAPITNWVHVMENLDHEGFTIRDESAFYLLMSIYALAAKEPFPLHAICGSLWTNTDGQISFLKHAVLAPADKFTFSHSLKQLEFPNLSSLSPGNHAWYCLDLLEVLCRLAEVGDNFLVQLMLEDPLEHCPELLLVGLGHVNTEHNLLQNEVLSRVFCTILMDTTKANIVKYLWNSNPRLTLEGFVSSHSNPNCLQRIVDLCRDLEILPAVLDFAQFPFNIKLAAAASRKFQSHVRKWLSEKTVVSKCRFLEECINFFKHILSNTCMEHLQAEIVTIYWGSFPVFVEVCKSHLGELVSTHLLEENSIICFDTICNKLEEQVEMTVKYFAQADSAGIIKNQICMLLQDLQSSKDRITEEDLNLFEPRLPTQQQQDVFENEYGPVICELKTLTKSNDQMLKDIRKGLVKYFDGDDLLVQVDKLFEGNKAAARCAGCLIYEYNDYLSRVNIEISWLDGAGEQIKRINGLLSGCSTALAELESDISELNRTVSDLPKECPQNLCS